MTILNIAMNKELIIVLTSQNTYFCAVFDDRGSQFWESVHVIYVLFLQINGV